MSTSNPSSSNPPITSPTTLSLPKDGQQGSGGSGIGEGGKPTGMFAFSYLFVRMYSRLADGAYILSLSIHVDGDKLAVELLDRECNRWATTITESQMEAYKMTCNAALAWQPFFEMMQKAFAEHTIEFDAATTSVKITVKHERQTDAVPIPPFSASFSFKLEPRKLKGNEVTDLAESMMSYVSLRTGDKREMERVENVSKVEAAVKDEAAQLVAEVEILQGVKKRCSKVCATAAQVEPELAEQLNALFGDEWRKVVDEEHNQERMLCRVADPLRAVCGPSTQPSALCCKYDAAILQAVKSQFIQQWNVPPHNFRYCNVLAPNVDLEAATAALDSVDERRAFMQALAKIDEWEFDVFAFESLCKALQPTSGGAAGPARALFMLGYVVLFKTGLCRHFNISEKCLLQWLSVIEAGYHDCPFHNATHAADVLHTTYFMLYPAEGAKKMKFGEVEQFVLLISAMIHDLGHEGLNNSFHISTKSHLSTVYADSSPVERRHLAIAYELMKLDRYDLFQCIPPAVRATIERGITECVLSTDLALHGQLVGHFRQRFLDNPDFSNPADVALAQKIIIKAADVSNCAKPWELYSQWVKKIVVEYEQQGAKEEASGVGRSPFMSSDISQHASTAKLQIAFINFVPVPLFSMLTELLPKLRVAGEYIALNKNRWANAELGGTTIKSRASSFSL